MAPAAQNGLEFGGTDWIQRMLTDFNGQLSLKKILDVKCSQAVGEGNNFIGDLLRLKIKFLNKKGIVEEKFFIYKFVPKVERGIPNDSISTLFENEIKVYSKVLKCMGKLFKTNNPDSDILWPKFYGVKGDNEGCLMEDLSALGFKMVDRRQELDFDHLKISLEALAKYHAAGAVLLTKGTIKKDMFKETRPYFVDENCVHRLISRPMRAILKHIENWSSEWQEYRDKVRNMDSTFVPRLLRIFEENDFSITTLNHGDCWSNNIMFKYDDEGHPVNVKLLDFQVPYINSPCFDLHYFLSANMKMNLLDRRNELLRHYYDSLERSLEMFQYERKVPTFEEIQQDFDRAKFLGYFVTLTLKAYFLNPNMHELARKFNVTDEREKFYLPHLYDGEYFCNILKNALKSMNDCGLFEEY